MNGISQLLSNLIDNMYSIDRRAFDETIEEILNEFQTYNETLKKLKKLRINRMDSKSC